MAVPTLALTYVERNDNKLITLTDITPDWGTPTIPGITTLTLDLSITTSDNVTVDYDLINLIPGAHPAVQADLVFQLTAADILFGTVPLGTAATVLPDGIYMFTYTLDAAIPATKSVLIEYVLMEGNVRNSVYDALRLIPTLYTCNECKSKEILDAIFAYGYLNSIRAGGYVAKTEELISQLYVLQRLLEYGSSYSW